MKPLLLALKQYHFKFIIHKEFGQDFYRLFQKYLWYLAYLLKIFLPPCCTPYKEKFLGKKSQTQFGFPLPT